MIDDIVMGVYMKIYDIAMGVYMNIYDMSVLIFFGEAVICYIKMTKKIQFIGHLILSHLLDRNTAR